MKNITFLGAAGEVTGSSYLLTTSDDSQLLIDLGMFQGPDDLVDLNYEPLSFNPSQIDAVFLTHAHLDHCGRLPLLIYGGFLGKIYMTEPTYHLVSIILTDAARVAKDKVDKPPLYDSDEVSKILDIIEIVEYGKAFTIQNSTITFRDAGHILGSASIEIYDTTDKTRMVFSGDLGNTPEDIVRPTEYIEAADYVVMETTYGSSLHPKDNPMQILKEEINAIEKEGGVLLIPAFSLERTQELLHKINHLKKDGKVRSDTPVFLDSPMAIHATTVFKDFKSFYNDELKSHTDDPFNFEGLVITEEARDSRQIIEAMNPKVIIAGSGMLSGGRMMHHATNYLSKSTTRIVFVGYQAEETLGRKILEGVKNIWIDDKQIKIKAHVREIASLSSHADQDKLFTWLKHIKEVKKVFLIHGDITQREVFKEKIIDKLATTVFLPLNGQDFDL